MKNKSILSLSILSICLLISCQNPNFSDSITNSSTSSNSDQQTESETKTDYSKVQSNFKQQDYASFTSYPICLLQVKSTF